MAQSSWLNVQSSKLKVQGSKFKVQSSKFKAQSSNLKTFHRFSDFQVFSFKKKTYQLHIVNFQWCNWYVSTDDEFYNSGTKAFELLPFVIPRTYSIIVISSMRYDAPAYLSIMNKT